MIKRLVGQLNDKLKSNFTSIANHSDFKREVRELDSIGRHFFIQYIPVKVRIYYSWYAKWGLGVTLE